MEERKVTSHIVKGVIASLVLIIIGVAGHFAGLESQGWFRWVSLAVLFVAVIWACISYSNQMNNHVTFGNLFAHGFKMSAVITVITIIWTAISLTLIFPETKEKALELAREQMEAKGNIPDSQIEQALDITRRFFLVFVIGSVLLGTLIIGAIASLIGAAVAKKNPVTPFEQTIR